jgi:hypothetical protein
MADIDDHWKYAANDLAALFSRVVGEDPYRQDKPQQFIATYTPPPGLWGDSEERLRQYFATMNRGEFASVYALLLTQRAEREVQALRSRVKP